MAGTTLVYSVEHFVYVCMLVVPVDGCTCLCRCVCTCLHVHVEVKGHSPGAIHQPSFSEASPSV